MPAKKKGKKKGGGLGPDPRARRKKEKPGTLWYILAMMALVGSIVELSCVGLTNWRSTNEYTVHWIKSDQEISTPYNPTSFGLYLVAFHGGATTTPWYRREQLTCAGVDYLAPLMEGTAAIRLWDAACDSTCLSHFRSRCQIYKQQSTLGYATMGVIIIAALGAMVGVGWFFIVGKSYGMLQVVWTGGGLATVAMLAWYVWSSDYDWGIVMNQSQYPYPSLAGAFYATCGGAGMITCSGIGVSVLAWLDERKKWKETQERIRQKVIEEAGGDFDPFAAAGGPPPGFGGPPGGPPGRPGMPPPGMGPPGRPGMPPPGMGPPGVPAYNMGRPPPGGGYGGPPPGFGPPGGGRPPPYRGPPMMR